jgi:hypothetical protein
LSDFHRFGEMRAGGEETPHQIDLTVLRGINANVS